METTPSKRIRTKSPALITRFKTATAQVEALTAQVTDLEKKLKTETSAKDSFYSRSNAYNAELEQLHCVFDALPGAAPRKTEGENSWDKKDITVMARLASFLAQRATHQ